MSLAANVLYVSDIAPQARGLLAPRRESPGAAALRDHAALCRQCADVGRAGLPPASLCGAGWILFTAAMRARARRSS